MSSEVRRLETKANRCRDFELLPACLHIEFVTFQVIFSVKIADFCQFTILKQIIVNP